jgi:hypothetical protein
VEQTVELFCGEMKAFSSIAGALGFGTFTADANPEFTPSLVADVREIETSTVPANPLVVWAAPPGVGFEAKHWREIDPIDQDGELALDTFRASVSALTMLKPKWCFIENPKSVLRGLPIVAGFNRGYPTRNRLTIRHDEYGGRAATETDAWPNAHWWIPQGGLRDGSGGADTGHRVPPTVFEEIFEQ